MEFYQTVVRFFQGGGEFMYPIAVVLALGIAIAIERYLFLTWTSANNQALWKKIVPYMQAGKFQEAVSITTGSKAAIGSILTYGQQRAASAGRRDDIEKAMEESLRQKHYNY